MPSLSIQNSQIEETLRSSLGSGSREQSLADLLISQSRAVLLKKIDFVEANKQTCAHDQSVKSKYVITKMTEQLERKKPVVVLNGEHKKSLDGEGLPQPKVVLYDANKLTTQWKQMARLGVGLNNLGNTCFCNATLQCLIFTPALFYYLSSRSHSQNCGLHGFCMVCTLEEHVRNISNRCGQVYSPWPVVKNFKAISKSFVLGRQEDAHEFLRYVIDNMTKALLWGRPKLDAFSKNTTAIHQIFGGYLRSQVRCKNCDHKSNTYDPFLDIALDIKEANNVQRGLEHFTKGEALFGDNAYSCEKCKRKVGAVKRFSIHKIPNVLTLQLKRFDAVRLNKINKDVYFPENLNIRPFMSCKQGEPVMYKLYGVLVHQGFSTSSGHYFSFVRSPSGQWLKADDARIFKVGLEQVLRQTAYILFYNKITDVRKSLPQKPTVSLQQIQQQQKTGILQHKHVNGPMGQPVNEFGTPVIRKTPTATATISRPSPLQPSTTQGPQYSKIASLAGRDKVSFGIKPKSEVKDTNNKQQNGSTSQNSPSKSPGVPLVIKIKDGKVVSNTASPPDVNKKIPDLSSTPGNSNTTVKTPVSGAKRKLVPYSNEDGSTSDSDSEMNIVKNKVKEVKISNGNSNGHVNGKSVLTNGHSNKQQQQQPTQQQQQGNRSNNPATHINKKSRQSPSQTNDFVPVLDEKLKTTTEVPGAYAPLDKQKVGGFKTPGQFKHVDHGHLTVKLATPDQCKVNSTTKWTVFEPEQKSPSLASSSASSVNSTSDWKIQETGDNKKSKNGNHIEGEAIAQIAGWNVYVNNLSPTHDNDDITNSKTNGDHKSNLIERKISNEGVQKSKIASNIFSCFLPQANTPSPVLNKSKGAPKHPAEEKKTTLKDEISNMKVQNASSQDESTSSLTDSFSTSDSQPLLEAGLNKKQKKKKKKKHKENHSADDDKMKIYEYHSGDELNTSDKKKKKKKKKRKHEKDECDDKVPLLSSPPSTGKKLHLENENGGSNSSTSEEFQWVERTKETIESEVKPTKTVPVQKWDQSFNKKTNGHSNQQQQQQQQQHNHQTNGHSNGFHNSNGKGNPSTQGWDGTRGSNGDVLEELHKESLQGYGSSVNSWDGGKSSIDVEVIRERRKDKKRGWDDDYEDELNIGKVKKVKHHNEQKFGGPNQFQKVQSWKIEGKFKERNLFEQFHPNNMSKKSPRDYRNNHTYNNNYHHNNKFGNYGNNNHFGNNSNFHGNNNNFHGNNSNFHGSYNQHNNRNSSQFRGGHHNHFRGGGHHNGFKQNNFRNDRFMYR